MSKSSMLRFAALLILAWLLPLGAHAATCSPSTSNASFGSVNSIAVDTTPQHTSTNNSFTCSGGLLNLLTTSSVYATFNSANNFQLKSANGSVPYEACADSGCTQPFVQNTQSSFNFFTLFSVFGLGGSVTNNFNLYYQTSIANVPAGIYTDTITVTWNWHICIAGVVTCLQYETSSATTTVNVTMTVTKACQINAAPNVNFGTQALIAGFSSINQSVNLTCTLNQPYLSYFTNGNNNDGTWNRMNLGTSYVQYNIYVPSTTTVWNLTNAQSGTGSGLAQSLPYTATINPNQAEQPAGTYTDNVSVTVEY